MKSDERTHDQRCIDRLEKRIAALEAENTVLKADCEKYRNAMEAWNRTAERGWRKLQAVMAAVVADKERLEAEIVELDKELKGEK